VARKCFVGCVELLMCPLPLSLSIRFFSKLVKYCHPSLPFPFSPLCCPMLFSASPPSVKTQPVPIGLAQILPPPKSLPCMNLLLHLNHSTLYSTLHTTLMFSQSQNPVRMPPQCMAEHLVHPGASPEGLLNE
jgi:hypothetical protein